MFCTKCGTILVEGAKFCTVCGASAVSVSAAPVSPDRSPPGDSHVYDAPQQPAYTLPDDAYAYTAPEQPAYTLPDDAYAYTAPEQPAYTPPDDAYAYTAPQQPAYTLPDDAYAYTAPEQPAYTPPDDAYAYTAPQQPAYTPPDGAYAYTAPEQPAYTPPDDAYAYTAPQQPAYTLPDDAYAYTAPEHPVYTPPAYPPKDGGHPHAAPENAGSGKGKRKGKRKIWIPIAAGFAVLVLAFGALSLFTDIFPWGGSSRDKQAATSSRRGDEDDNGNADGARDASQQVTPVPQEGSSAQDKPSPTKEVPEPDETDDLRANAITRLNALGCPIMDESDNRIGIRIHDIEKVDDGYKIYWDSDLGSGNAAFMFSLMRFFDPDDYSNNYQPFTISDGSLEYTFGEGDWISYTEFRVRDFEPDCMMFHLYFEGALESMGATPDIQTDPLFFTFILGDEPALVEESPRFANGIFDGYIAPDAKAEEPSGVPAEYVGHWIGYAAGSYLDFVLQADGSGEYIMTDGTYTENYIFNLELGTETFSVQIPKDNTSGVASIDGTYDYSEGMLILNIRTTLNSGSVLPRSTVPCVRVSDSGGGDVVEQDFEIRTAVYDMIVFYIGQWKDGKPNGAGVAIVLENIPGRFESGDALAGTWVDGLLEGPGVYTSFDGIYSLRGTFIKGLKEGTVRQYQNGEYIRDMEFVNGSPAN